MNDNLVIGRCVHIFHGQKGPLDPFFAHELTLRESKKHRILVYTWNKDREKPRIERVNCNYYINWLDGPNLAIKPLFEEYPFLPKLSEALSRNKHDLLHAISHLFLPTYSCIKKATTLGIPTVVSVHGVLAQRNLMTNLLQYSYMLSLGSYVYRKSTIVHCLTQSDADSMIRLGCRPDKIAILPNPVDTEAFKPIAQVKVNQIIWAGRFVPEKGIEYLIHAFKLVKNVKKRVELLLIGEGPERARITALVHSLGLDDSVFFKGPIDSRMIAKQLSKSALFVLPSIREGFPRILLEAMSSEKPIIAFRIPGINEIIKHGYNGLLVTPGDSGSLAKAILGLLDDDDLARHLSVNARQTILNHYTWEEYLRKLNLVYKKALRMN